MSRSMRAFRRKPLSVLVQIALPAMFAAPMAHAITCNVNSTSDDPSTASATVTAATTTGTLRDCILAVNLAAGSSGAPNGPHTIATSGVQGATITLADSLPLIFNNVAIGGGAPVTIAGGGHRIFLVSGLPDSTVVPEPDRDGAQAITVSLNSLILQNGGAQGGNGGAGGMGAGGALFVNKNATVNLNQVSFSGNSATGGNGFQAGYNSGGGGMGGGSSYSQGAGGLGGTSTDNAGGGIGTNSSGGTGGNFGGTGVGQISNAQNFGTGFGPGGYMGAGGIGGGGAYTLNGSGTGGFGAGGGANSAGGFGGGGGMQSGEGGGAGAGGFGGGGGTGRQGFFGFANGYAGAAGAIGGFGAGGGGGGGGGGCQAPGTPGSGGVGGNGGVGGGIGATGAPGYACPGAGSASGTSGGGGGGAGFGGAVFVRAGGTLNVTANAGTFETAGSASGGPGGAGGSQGAPATAGSGAAAGAGLFFMSGSIVNFNVAGNVVIDDAVDDDSPLALPGGSYTAGSGAGNTINLGGNGTLTMNGNGSVGVVVANGTLGGGGTVGDVELDAAADGYIAPGNSPGTLHAHRLRWKGGTSPTGGGIKFQLGSSSNPGNSDLMQMGTSLDKDTSTGSTYVFHFGDGTGTPTPGADYVLMSFATTTFSASDFSSNYSGALSNVTGTFSIGPNPAAAPVHGKAPAALPPNALMFHVNNPTPVRLQSFEVD